MTPEMPSLEVAYNLTARELRENYPDDYKEVEKYQSVETIPKSDLIKEKTDLISRLGANLETFVCTHQLPTITQWLSPAYMIHSSFGFTDRTQWVVISESTLYTMDLINTVQQLLREFPLWRIAIVFSEMRLTIYPCGVRFGDIPIPNGPHLEAGLKAWCVQLQAEEDWRYGWLKRQLPALQDQIPKALPIVHQDGGTVLLGFKEAGPNDSGTWIIWTLQCTPYRLRLFEKTDGQLGWDCLYVVSKEGAVISNLGEDAEMKLICYYWRNPRAHYEMFFRWLDSGIIIEVLPFAFVG